MESPDPDRLLKRVWLVNGFMVLVLSALGIVGLGVIFLPSMGGGDSDGVAAAPAARLEGSAPRAVRFGLPERVHGTTTELVRIQYGRDFTNGLALVSMGSGSGEAYSYSGSSHRGPLVNVAFLPAGGGAARLLFDRPVRIERLSYPAAERDSLRTWISYEVVIDDTDGDGTLEEEDGATVFVSALDGTGLRRALPEGWRVISHGSSSDGRALVLTALPAHRPRDRDAADEAQQRSFLHDVAAGDTRPYVALDSAAASAARLLGGRVRRGG